MSDKIKLTFNEWVNEQLTQEQVEKKTKKKLNKMAEITEEQFEAYVEVQESGQTNMFDIKMVEILSGLEKEEIMTIMKSYGELKEKYDV